MSFNKLKKNYRNEPSNSTNNTEKPETSISYKIINGVPRLMISIDEENPNHTEDLCTLVKIMSDSNNLDFLISNIKEGYNKLGKQEEFKLFNVDNDKPVISPLEVI